MSDPEDPENPEEPQRPLDVFPPNPGDEDYVIPARQTSRPPPELPRPPEDFGSTTGEPYIPGFRLGSQSAGSFAQGPGFSQGSATSTAAPTAGADASDFNQRRDHQGNYLLTIGNPHSGKSTFQRHLAMCLLTATDDYASELITGADWRPRKILTEWQKQWYIDGTFPAPTKADEIDEFHFRVTPHARRNLPLEFRFVEIAGENFVDLMLLANVAPKIPDGLSHLLANPSVQLTLALAVDGEIPPGQALPDRNLVDDLVFANFLALLNQLRPRGSAPDIKVMILVAKPEAAIGIKLGRAHPETPERRDRLFDFARRKLPTTWGVLSDPQRLIDSQVFGMSVGAFYGEQEHRRIVKPNFEDAHNVFSSVYRGFTGKHILPWYRRILQGPGGGGE